MSGIGVRQDIKLPCITPGLHLIEKRAKKERSRPFGDVFLNRAVSWTCWSMFSQPGICGIRLPTDGTNGDLAEKKRVRTRFSFREAVFTGLRINKPRRVGYKLVSFSLHSRASAHE